MMTSPLSGKEEANRAVQFIEKIEELDDVQRVYANFDIPDDLMQQLS